MKVLLIRPPVPKHTIGLKNIMVCEPLELEYVAAGIPQHEVRILDLIVENNFMKRFKEFNPDVIGTSSYISGVNEVFKICRAVKRIKPACITVVGGVQAAQVPEDFLDNSIDLIIRGDGTTAMPLILEALENGKDLREIPGIAIPKSNSELYHSPQKAYMPKADDLPLPNRKLVDHLKHKYYYLMHRPVATMKTTWGCWYKCNFCYTWKITDGTPYARSPENIVEELKTIEAKEIYIVDDIFLIKPSRLARLAELILENNIQKNYLVYARADFISQNEEIIAEWAHLGLKAVFIGLEAVTDHELENMNKESGANENYAAIKVLQKHGVDIYGSLIPHPDYTVEDWKKLRKFINDSGLYYLNISPLVPLPGTDIYDQFKDKIIVPREAHGMWDLSHVVTQTKLPIKEYYWQLLITYASVVYNLPRANRVTKRTLPSIWSWNYLRLLWGASKIGWQFINAHRHHSKKELKIAMDKGLPVDLPYSYSRLIHEEKKFLKAI